MAARPATLPAAVAPVLVGTASAASIGRLHWAAAVACLAVALGMQVGVNLANDVADFLHGADRVGRRGPLRVTAAGLLTPAQVWRGAWVAFGLSCTVGLYLVWLRGWPLVLVGLASVAAALAYTSGPRFGYRGMGELFVFVFFGLVATAGTDFVQTGLLRAEALAAAVPVGLSCTSILVVNNLRDLPIDAVAGKRTLAVRLGPTATRMFYGGCWLVAVVWPALLRAMSLVGERFWLPWISVPLVGRAVVELWTAEDPASFNRMLSKTARLHLLFGILWAVALVP